MAAGLVSQIQLVMLIVKTQPLHPHTQMPMRSSRPALTFVGLECANWNPQRHTGIAAIAIRAVGEHTAAPESIGNQVRISVVVNQVAGRGHLTSGQPARQIAAGVRRGHIKLQNLKRQICKVRHFGVGLISGGGFASSTRSQYMVLNFQCGAG